jgi:virulence factor Mce-like protein
MAHARRFNPLYVGTVTVVVMLVVISIIMISGIPGGPTIGLPWNHMMTVKAQLSDADALAPKASVQIAGVKVGEIRTVDLQGGQAIVTMSIQPQYGDIHSDARVLLRPHGLFGPKYIELVPGTSSSPLLHDGDTIPGTQSVLAVDLDQILQELQAPERHQLTTAIVELGRAAAGRGTDFNHLVAAGNTLFNTLDSPVKSLSSVSSNLSDMLVQDEAFNASFAQTPLDQLVANSNTTLAAFAQSSQQLGSLLDNANSTLASLDQALSGESGNLRTTLEQLPAVIDKYETFSDQFTIFGNLLSGQYPGIPGSLIDSAHPQFSIAAAIENPLSATSGSDSCPPNPAPLECSPLDGRRHYVRVQTFSSGNIPQGTPAAPGAYVRNLAPYPGPDSTAPIDLLAFGDLIGS